MWAREVRLVLALCLLASAASAQTPMTPEEFETWATGRTLDYAVDGNIWGSEAYLPGREVMDADTGGPCRSGHWYPKGGAVCFVYDGLPGEHCWRFWREGDEVLARALSADRDSPAQSVTPAAGPLVCPAPDVGA